MSDLFRLQNEITGQIASALQFELAIADAGRFTEHPDALDYILRGRAAWWKSTYRSKNAEALGLFERALDLDPHAVEAQIWLAFMLINHVLDFVSDAPDVDLRRADELIARALTRSPNSAWTHYVKGQRGARRRWSEGRVVRQIRNASRRRPDETAIEDFMGYSVLQAHTERSSSWTDQSCG